MFQLSSKRQVLWPVTIYEPADDGSGTVVDRKIRVRFVLLDRDEMAEAIVEAEAVGADAASILSPASMATNDKWLTDRIVDWVDVVDVVGEETVQIPFSADRLAALMRIPYVKKALDMALWEVSRGAPAKN